VAERRRALLTPVWHGLTRPPDDRARWLAALAACYWRCAAGRRLCSGTGHNSGKRTAAGPACLWRLPRTPVRLPRLRARVAVRSEAPATPPWIGSVVCESTAVCGTPRAAVTGCSLGEGRKGGREGNPNARHTQKYGNHTTQSQRPHKNTSQNTNPRSHANTRSQNSLLRVAFPDDAAAVQGGNTEGKNIPYLNDPTHHERRPALRPPPRMRLRSCACCCCCCCACCCLGTLPLPVPCLGCCCCCCCRRCCCAALAASAASSSAASGT